ncbi:hypothetical protein Ndes2526B_g07847 [Nannochloris sp. 'desiccata']
MSALIGALRLLQSSGRGLIEALPLNPVSHTAFTFSSTSLGRTQPWMLSRIQAYSTSPSRIEEPSSSSPPPKDSSNNNLDLPESITAPTAPSTSSPPAQPTEKLPAGHIDFTKRQLIMMYTCGKCEVRSAKAFSKVAYTEGVVIVECPGCGARHLIADHLGWFGTKGTIEEFAKERGEMIVTKLDDHTLELEPLTVKDAVGGVAHAAAMKIKK